MSKAIVPIVEGYGEMEAINALLGKLLRDVERLVREIGQRESGE
jgi:hypothetical protein